MKKLIIVNFKTNKEATGRNAEKMARKFKDLNIIIVAQNADVHRLSKIARTVFAQHIDPVEYGSHTGKDLAECLKENGARGALINHSEDRTDLKTIEKCVEICRKTGLLSVVCADKPELAAKIARFSPDYIAIEPPELIGTLVSVSKVKPAIITNTIEKVRKINKKVPVLCGAGVADGNDVRKAIELGSSGIILATAVVKAKNPRKKVIELLKGANLK